MSKDNQGGNTNSTKSANFDLRRAIPMYLEDDAFAVQGTKQQHYGFGIVVEASAGLLAQSRRDGGLEHSIGVMELEDNTLGLIALRGAGEIHYILFDPAARVMRDIIEEGERCNCFLNIFLMGEGDALLSILPDHDQMCEVIRNASRCASCDTTRFAEANLELAEHLQLAQAQSELARESTPDVVLHSLLSDRQFD